jgi:hypothetical protein
VASRAEAIGSGEPLAGEAAALPAAASLRGSIRSALSDLYFHSWRLVPANIVWSLVAIPTLIVTILAPIGLLGIAILAVPTAGIFRMTTEIARGEAVSFWDSIGAWRHSLATTLALGAAIGVSSIVLVVNLVTGILAQSVVGWAFATLAFWGLVAVWLLAWTVWPILADPWRAGWPAKERVRLAGYLVLAHPIRVAAVGLFLAILLVASAVAIVALLTVSVAIAALVATRYVLPAADRLDDRLGFAARHGLLEARAPVED